MTLPRRCCCCRGEGGDLVGRARLRHLGRRAGAAADHGRRARRAVGGVLPVGEAGPLGADRHGGDDGRHHALAAHRDRLRGRAHPRSRALLPLLVACIAAHAVTVLLLRRSILTEKVARRGHHVIREYIVDPFETMRVARDHGASRSTRCRPTCRSPSGRFFTAPEARRGTRAIPWSTATAGSSAWCRAPTCCAGRRRDGRRARRSAIWSRTAN